MRILIAILFAQALVAANFYVDPIMVTAGVYQTITNYQEHITTSGTPSAGSAQRGYIGFPMSNTNKDTLQVYLPAGVTGTCSHGPCNFVAYGSAVGGSCDTNGQWPQTIPGKVGIRMVGCVDFSTSGAIQYITNANTIITSEPIYDHDEGSQTIQGPCGPGPLTFRNNDFGFTGNPMHFADDCNVNHNPEGITVYKSDYWIYRNRFTQYWPGMNHWLNPGRDGNVYGNRAMAMEWKGGNNITIEGNDFLGNYNGGTQANVSMIIILRNVNQGISNSLIADNMFQHMAGGFLVNDYNKGVPSWAPSGTSSAIINNVMLDVNQLGPDIYGIGNYNNSLASGSGTYAVALGQEGVISGQGWLLQGPALTQGVTMQNNTFPDLHGAIPVFDYTTTVTNGGLNVLNNFIGWNSGSFAPTTGVRAGDNGAPDYPVHCTNDGQPKTGNNNWLTGYTMLTCAWPVKRISGNVLLSENITAAQMGGDGWVTNNTVLGNSVAKTTIWPKYNLNPCGSNMPWTCALDPESVRLPTNSPYAGKGADITHLKNTMGWIDNPTAAFDASNNLIVTWVSPDSVPYTVDVATTGQLYGTFSRFKLDTGGTRNRRITIPAGNFTAHTAYDVRINSETLQTVINGLVTQPVLHVKSN